MTGEPGPTAHDPARRGPAAWVVVLLTLAGVGVVLLAFGAGAGVGFWAAGASGGAGSVAGPVDPVDPGPVEPRPDGSAGTRPGTLDPCLVETWRTTEHEESYDTEQGQASLTDLDRTMTFTEDGTQTITYDGSQATVATEQGALPAVFEGTVVYRASTSGMTMSFQLQSSEGTVVVLGPDGRVAEENPLEPGTGDVTYTCDETSLVQEATGYRSVYERVD